MRCKYAESILVECLGYVLPSWLVSDFCCWLEDEAITHEGPKYLLVPLYLVNAGILHSEKLLDYLWILYRENDVTCE